MAVQWGHHATLVVMTLDQQDNVLYGQFATFIALILGQYGTVIFAYHLKLVGMSQSKHIAV